MTTSGVLSLAQRKSLFSIFEAWYNRAGELMREVQTSKVSRSGYSLVFVMCCSRQLFSMWDAFQELN
jgi:hypothetical protein